MEKAELARRMAVRLREARAERKLTQAQAEAAAGLGTKTVASWENRDGRGFGRHGPSLFQLGSLADLYDVSIDWLLGRSEIRRPMRPGDSLVDVDRCESLLADGSGRGTNGESETAPRWQIPARPRLCRPGDPYLDQLDRSLNGNRAALAPTGLRTD